MFMFTVLNYYVRMRLKEQKEALEQMGYKDMSRWYHLTISNLHSFKMNINNAKSIASGIFFINHSKICLNVKVQIESVGFN